ncbi:MAG TPA: hypothetical protein VNB49_17730, partial [Candidatus Dormibacteraeota bacterium]|nr:hypothetical protein [Candidatus Dormibacteraeota bacterium]
MNSALPRLRSDLIVRPQQTAHGTSVVIKNPNTGKFFRLGEAEHFIAQQLDGETSLEVIRQRTEARFEGELPVEALYTFLQNLRKQGVLETTGTSKKPASRKPKRFRGGPLYCRFKVFDPCKLLKRLVRPAAFFYTTCFGLLSASTILLAMGVTIDNWSDFRVDVHRLYHVSAIPLIMALNFLVVGAHEFGHGLTCTRFGGEVHEMGCALVFLQPAFYCNVSDAWLFPEKSKRLWVGFAGPYFELFLWALAALAWRVTEANTPVNFMALSVMATSGLKTLLNFNPLIKLDGYYLLSDYLEIPNLRRRSFRHVGIWFESLFGFGASPEAEESISRRERRIFSVYGTVALAGSFSIMGFILIKAFDSVAAGRAPMAVLISLALLGMKFRRRFRRMFGNSSGASGSFADEDFDAPDEIDGSDERGLLDDAAHFQTPPVGAPAKLALSKNDVHLGAREAPGLLSDRLLPIPTLRADTDKGLTLFDELVMTMSGSRVDKMLGRAPDAFNSFGHGGAFQTSHAVTAAEEPAVVKEIGYSVKPALASSLSQAAVSGSTRTTVVTPYATPSAPEPAAPKNGD